MRNTVFDLDQDSTIVSILASRRLGHGGRASRIVPVLMTLLGGLVVFLSILYFKGGLP